MGLLYAILIGIFAGWLAGQILKGKGFGLLGNLLVGIAGAILGSFAFKILGLSADNLIGRIVMSAFGAILFLLLLGFIRKK
jgi:uncharacterized membrane protein YeaQ/YmgE (transglycosylase-associated protein family)